MSEIDNALFHSSDFNDFLFNNLYSAIFIVDKDFRVRMVNDTFKTLFNRDDTQLVDQLCGNSLGCKYAVEADKPCGTTEQCATCSIRTCLSLAFADITQIQTTYLARVFYIAGSPVNKHFRMQVRQIVWAGNPVVIIMIDDVTELEEQKQRLADMANRDFLTSLYNRRYFFEVSHPLFENAKRGSIRIALAMLDIDHFKRVNDTWGHSAGDAVIQKVSSILQTNLRKADILARFGGEEFCALLVCKNPDDAYSVIDKIRLIVEQTTFVHEGKTIPVTISAGLTTHPEDTLELMIQKADDMLYKAKTSGRNRTEEYMQSISEKIS